MHAGAGLTLLLKSASLPHSPKKQASPSTPWVPPRSSWVCTLPNSGLVQWASLPWCGFSHCVNKQGSRSKRLHLRPLLFNSKNNQRHFRSPGFKMCAANHTDLNTLGGYPRHDFKLHIYNSMHSHNNRNQVKTIKSPFVHYFSLLAYLKKKKVLCFVRSQ